MKTFFLSLLFSANAFAGGGSLVGNAAGLMENRFQYAYMTLHKMILNCVINEDCGLSADDLKLVNKVAEVMGHNMNNPSKFVFLSEAELSKIAVPGLVETHRIAMTGLTPDTPIYVNVDLLYSSDGQPQLEYGAIGAIIFHEVGHQAGEPDHQRLDLVGTKIRLKMDAETRNYPFELDAQEKLEVSFTNFAYPNKFAEIRLTRGKSKLINLSPLVVKQLKCRDADMQISGYDFYNGFFTPQFNQPTATFNFIANLYCVKKGSARPVLERIQVKFDVTPETHIQNWAVRKSQ